LKNFNYHDLAIVILKSPYESLVSSEGKKIFSNMIDIKIKGYLSYHESGALPLDTTDFLGDHMLVVNKNDPFNEIYMSYKSTSYKVCEKFNVAFPFTTILNNYASKECSLEFQNILNECRAKGEDLSYDTGWSINPKFKGNEEMSKTLKELVSLIVVNHHSDHYFAVPHWVTLGILKVKTDKIFLAMGCKEISNAPLFNHPYLNNTECRAVISRYQQYTDIVFAQAKKHQALWDNRILISKQGAVGPKRKLTAA